MGERARCAAAVMHQYQGRIKELEEELSSLKEKHKALGTRRTLDLEGFSRDVTNLRKQVPYLPRTSLFCAGCRARWRLACQLIRFI